MNMIKWASSLAGCAVLLRGDIAALSHCSGDSRLLITHALFKQQILKLLRLLLIFGLSVSRASSYKSLPLRLREWREACAFKGKTRVEMVERDSRAGTLADVGCVWYRSERKSV